MPKRKGNPNWGRPMGFDPHGAFQLCDFERLILSHNLCSPKQVVESPVVRGWVERNYNHKYVPEWLLQQYGIAVHLLGDDF